MTKTSQFLIFGDQSWPVESLAKALPDDTEVSIWIDGKGWVTSKRSDSKNAKSDVKKLESKKIESKKVEGKKSEPKQNLKSRQSLSLAKVAQGLNVSEATAKDAVAIVGFQDPETSQKVALALKTQNASIKILQVGTKSRNGENPQARRFVAWSDLISSGVDTEIYLLTIQDRVRELRNCLKDCEKVALLLQDDPDPDGLAAALALRKVLGRNAQTAPICSFGSVTRPENVAMARLLDIEISTVSVDELHAFERIVMIDCQPSFFKGRRVRADVILDHHPQVEFENDSPVLFQEIREDLGAISTLMTQYLRAAGMELSQRLATALLYGIKSDTLTLNREVSEQDLEAFVYLYRRINGNILRRIERPELPMAYIEALRKGLKNLKVEHGIAVLPLDKVDREEWIPQAADFALQCEGAQWALAVGTFNGKVIISGRNAGYVQHCGEVFKAIFDKIGCAGGHRTMAKAIIGTEGWEREFGKCHQNPAKLASMLSKRLFDAISDPAKSAVR